ncbi:MAG: S8 family peptidase [Pseudonocardiaceae bacterium]
MASAEPTTGRHPTSSSRACDTNGSSLRYLVVFDKDTSALRAERAITKACGSTTTYYRQIAVAVARSADPAFESRIGPDRTFSAQALRGDGSARSSWPPSADAHPRRSAQATDVLQGGGGDRTGEQWDMRMINADVARAINPGSPDVVVGVLDSGIDATHPELADAVAPDLSVGCLTGEPDTSRRAWAPTDSVHGTHVAGTIAAADDGAGVTGVAPGVRIASIKVIGEQGHVDPEAVICGLMWAAEHEMQVTNSSYFIDPMALSCTSREMREDMGAVREGVARATEFATAAGTLNIAAVTNEAVNLSLTPGSGSTAEADGCQALPAGLRPVVAVSSVGPDRVKAGYSSYGLGVIGVTAPGGESQQCVLSTVPGGYDRACGTSMAAPHVAGVAALVASTNPDYGPEQVRDALTSGAQSAPCPTDYDVTGNGKQDAYCSGYREYNGFYGHGLVDALTAVTPDLPRTGSDS